MKRKFIPAEESFRKWKKDPKYVAEYEALEKEFALASALLEARSKADMTQEEVAEAMGTTQAVVAVSRAAKYCPRRVHWNALPEQPALGFVSALNPTANLLCRRADRLPISPERSMEVGAHPSASRYKLQELETSEAHESHQP